MQQKETMKRALLKGYWVTGMLRLKAEHLSVDLDKQFLGSQSLTHA